MGTLTHALASGGTIHLSGEALSVDEIRAPDVPVLTVEAGETAEIGIDVVDADAWHAEIQGLAAPWYTVARNVMVLHPPYSDAASPPGEYNFLLQLSKSGATTAIPGRLRLLPPGGRMMSSRLLDYLPGIFADNDPFMGRFLLIFESMLDPIEHLVDNAHVCLDPDFAPARFLPWLATWVGVDLDPTMDQAQHRGYLRLAVELYKWKGTQRALRQQIQTTLGAQALIVENFDGMRIGQDAALGLNTLLGQRRDGAVTVTLVASRPAAIDPIRADALIEGLIPADVTHTLRLVPHPTAAGGEIHG